MVALSVFDFAAAAAALALALYAWRHERPFVWSPGRDVKPSRRILFARYQPLPRFLSAIPRRLYCALILPALDGPFSIAFSPALVAGALGNSLATVPLSLALCALAAATRGAWLPRCVALRRVRPG